MAGSTKLNKDGLNKVWLKVMELIQSLTGNVDRTKGTLQEQIDVKATSEDYGRVKVTNSSAVTDSTGLTLAATEKNASIDGTLANQIDKLNSNLGNKDDVQYAIETESDVWTLSKTVTLSAGIYIFIPYFIRNQANTSELIYNQLAYIDSDNFNGDSHNSVFCKAWKGVSAGAYCLTLGNESNINIFFQQNSGETIITDIRMSIVRLK